MGQGNSYNEIRPVECIYFESQEKKSILSNNIKSYESINSEIQLSNMKLSK